MPHFLQEHPPRGWPRQKSLHLSLSTHSFLACSNPFALPTPLSLMYSSILSFHPLSGLPLLLGPSLLLTNFFLVFHSSCSQCDQCIPLPPLHTSFHLHKFQHCISHTCFHCSHSPILSVHMPLSESSLLCICAFLRL